MATAEGEKAGLDLNVSIDGMTEHDLLEVCQIEEMTDLSTWGWDAYHTELRAGVDTIMLVARVDSSFHKVEVAGFIVARLVADELHVNNVAVRPEFRRSGIGLRLLKMTLATAKKAGAMVAQLEVRAGNEAAQALYALCGFQSAGCRKNYYRDPTEDALLMSLSLDGNQG
jgi:ribosomal-protein-alanine N-acetyltransferase